MFRVALCDDSEVFLNYEKNCVESFLSDRGVDYKCDIYLSGNELIEKSNDIRSYDLIILDYEMDGLTGFETAERIHLIDFRIPIAFATVFFDFTCEGYKYGAVRYLIKREETFKADLFECLEHVVNLRSKNNNIVLALSGSTISVDVNDIIYISSEKHYVRYFIYGEDVTNYNLRRSSLDEVCEELPENFIRIHQRYIVNVKYATKIHDRLMDVRIDDQTVISLPIAKRKISDVTRKYSFLKGAFS
ncbi:MAG: response regulator transcription factor [Eubacterium sp.]|nr:response regulator transcription factor [Clostridiales bacterium]MBR6404005.1 response regulator transcription factor [Eubacterium sp.]